MVICFNPDSVQGEALLTESRVTHSSSAAGDAGMHAWDDQQSFQHLARYGPGDPGMNPNLIMVRTQVRNPKSRICHKTHLPLSPPLRRQLEEAWSWSVTPGVICTSSWGCATPAQPPPLREVADVCRHSHSTTCTVHYRLGRSPAIQSSPCTPSRLSPGRLPPLRASPSCLLRPLPRHKGASNPRTHAACAVRAAPASELTRGVV